MHRSPGKAGSHDQKLEVGPAGSVGRCRDDTSVAGRSARARVPSGGKIKTHEMVSGALTGKTIHINVWTQTPRAETPHPAQASPERSGLLEPKEMGRDSLVKYVSIYHQWWAVALLHVQFIYFFILFYYILDYVLCYLLDYLDFMYCLNIAYLILYNYILLFLLHRGSEINAI